MFRLHPIARSTSVTMSIDLLLACYLANAACVVSNSMTALIFIIVSWLHAFFLVVVVRSSLHALVAVAVNHCFQQHLITLSWACICLGSSPLWTSFFINLNQVIPSPKESISFLHALINSSNWCYDHEIHDGIHWFQQQIVRIPTAPVSIQIRSETQCPVQIDFFAEAHNSSLAHLPNATFLTWSQAATMSAVISLWGKGTCPRSSDNCWRASKERRNDMTAAQIKLTR